MDITFEITDFYWEICEQTENQGWLNCEATVTVYWGDSGSSSVEFKVHHTMYFDGETLTPPSDYQDFDNFNSDLKAGLGMLQKAFRHEIETALYANFWKEWLEFLKSAKA